MFEVIRNLGDEAFSFKFEGSALLDKLIGGRHGIFLIGNIISKTEFILPFILLVQLRSCVLFHSFY